MDGRLVTPKPSPIGGRRHVLPWPREPSAWNGIGCEESSLADLLDARFGYVVAGAADPLPAEMIQRARANVPAPPDREGNRLGSQHVDKTGFRLYLITHRHSYPSPRALVEPSGRARRR